MMFSLDMPTEPHWIDLPLGVRVRVKPIDGVTVSAARTFAFSCANTLIEQRKEREAAGTPTDDLLDLTDPALRDGFVKIQLAGALARYGALDWEGVGDDTGAPLPFSKAGAERLARHPVMFEPFLDGCFAPAARVAAEGNASAPALNGSTDAGAAIATAAASPAETVLVS